MANVTIEYNESLILIIAVLLLIAWKWYRRGSFTGAMLGARIKNTIGEITVSSSILGTNVLKVHTLETPPGVTPQIALVLISKALPFAASMTDIKLSQVQARQLVGLLEKATAVPSV